MHLLLLNFKTIDKSQLDVCALKPQYKKYLKPHEQEISLFSYSFACFKICLLSIVCIIWVGVVLFLIYRQKLFCFCYLLYIFSLYKMNKLNFIVPSVLNIMNKITEISGYKFISRVVYIIQKNTQI